MAKTSTELEGKFVEEGGTKMNKWIAIPIIGVLAVGLIATGVFYLQGTNKLEDAQSEIVALEENVSALGTGLADSEAEVLALEGDISALGTELADSEAEVLALEGGLADSEAEVSALGTELADAEARAVTLESELDEANSATQTQQSLNLTLSEELEKVKDPRHFETLEELEAWLEQDDTDTRIRFESVSPEERAFILQVRALRDGYLLPAWFEDFSGITGDHFDGDHFDGFIDYVGNLAYIGDEIYYVWAADDSLLLYVFDVFPIPSHPLPLD